METKLKAGHKVFTDLLIEFSVYAIVGFTFWYAVSFYPKKRFCMAEFPNVDVYACVMSDKYNKWGE